MKWRGINRIVLISYFPILAICDSTLRLPKLENREISHAICCTPKVSVKESCELNTVLNDQ